MIFNAYSDTDRGLFGVAVKSCGHIFAKHGRAIHRPKGRDDYLLFYVAKGSERFILEEEADAAEGSFVFFKPHERQEHVCLAKETAEFYYVHFSAPPDFDLFGFESSVIYTAKPSTKVRDLFEEIIVELQKKQISYEKICVSKIFEIMGILTRRVADLHDPQGQYADRIAAVIQLMNRDYAKDDSLDDYADICKMSKFHFMRIFKKITGVSPVEYKNKIRIEHAKDLLEDLSVPICEVGARVGYASPSYFCDAFKKKTGCSPRKYREMLNNN